MKIGRNDPCPCGSGRKYKRCHLDEDAAAARAAADAGEPYLEERGGGRGMAQAMVDFVQPLLDRTDGSMEQTERVMQLGMVWWNLAMMPAAEREQRLNETIARLELEGEALEGFKEATEAMIERHERMFPALHVRRS